MLQSTVANALSAVTVVTLTSVFTQLLEILVTNEPNLFTFHNYPPDKTHEVFNSVDKAYDYVVVGGGSAGSVVASRLSEMANCTVLLIEAGVDPSWVSEVPAAALMLQKTGENWGYKTELQKDACLSMRNKQCNWAKGKALGGSSVINAMLYVPGNKRDFDDWAAAGNPGWSYEDVLPYFKKSQEMQADYIAKHGTEQFGTNGVLPLRKFNASAGDIHNILLRGTEELGFKTMDGFPASDQIGFGNCHATANYGKRFNVAKAFLAPIKDRKNLVVMKGAVGNKVIMADKTAVGVEVTVANGDTVIVKAKKEVILSAGSIATPQILMLSGIGPSEHLKEMKIDVVKDLPVGQNLQDHVVWLGPYFTYQNKTRPGKILQIISAATQYVATQTGFLANLAGSDLMGFVDVYDPKGSDYPNIQYMASIITTDALITPYNYANGFGLDASIEAGLRSRAQTNESIAFSPILLHPESRGELKLRSSNPKDKLKIFANYYQERKDVDTLLKSLDILNSLAQTETFKKHGIELRAIPIAECNKHKIYSEAFWECNLRHTGGTLWHPVGTCTMGPKNDPKAVVDHELRVHGINKLRVIDASIMPTVTSGNTNAPSIMIGEKGAAMIKDQWRSECQCEEEKTEKRTEKYSQKNDNEYPENNNEHRFENSNQHYTVHRQPRPSYDRQHWSRQW